MQAYFNFGLNLIGVLLPIGMAVVQFIKMRKAKKRKATEMREHESDHVASQ